jgi:GNAT superfamily N-acetyltransferase
VSDLPDEFVPTPGFIGPPVARIAAKTAPLPEDRRQQVQVPEQLVPVAAAPSERVGKTAESVFGRKVSDADLDALAGAQASLPDGLRVDVKVEENARKKTKDVRITGAVKNDKGEVVGNFTRTFERDGDNTVVRHGFFGINDDQRNAGLGSKLFNAQVDAYRKQGISKVTLDAQDVGRYVWTKAGFEWDDAAQVARVMDKLRDELTKRYSASVVDKIMAATKTPQDIARLVVNGEKVGKQLLIGLEDEIVGMSQTPAKIRRL